VAIESSDLTLMRGDLSGVPTAIRLSRRTYRTILQNLGWAFGYNTAAIPLAAFGLLNPIIAGAAMGFSSVSVVTNSLRLRRFGKGRAAKRADAPKGRPVRQDTHPRQRDYVRVHLYDGTCVDGWRKSSSRVDAPVLLIDAVTVSDSRGAIRAGTPLDAFIPEADVTRVEPIAVPAHRANGRRATHA